MADFISITDVDPDTQRRILEFLNAARRAEDIGGIEPQKGPIYDHPDIGHPAGYDIGLIVAQRILDRRATLPGSKFTDLSQLSNIKGFGEDKFIDLVYSFSKLGIDIMSMAERFGTEIIPHSYVYRRWESLEEGHIYHFETRNLTKLSTSQSLDPDPVMYLVQSSSNEIVARNDDYIGLASTIIYSPSVTGGYLLIIRAYATETPGYCDLYKGVDNMPPPPPARVKFGGTRIYTKWDSDEWFETKLDGGSGDTYLYLIQGDYVGGHLYRNDDGGIRLCSKIVPESGGSPWAIVGSYSPYSEGQCRLYLYYKSYMIRR